MMKVSFTAALVAAALVGCASAPPAASRASAPAPSFTDVLLADATHHAALGFCDGEKVTIDTYRGKEYATMDVYTLHERNEKLFAVEVLRSVPELSRFIVQTADGRERLVTEEQVLEVFARIAPQTLRLILRSAAAERELHTNILPPTDCVAASVNEKDAMRPIEKTK